jgi:hypothetical protein
MAENKRDIEENSDDIDSSSEKTDTNESLQKLTINTSTWRSNVDKIKSDNDLDLLSNRSSQCENDSVFMSSSNRNLTDLPPELILLIFSYLNARFSLQVLCQVCKNFNDLLSPEATWKTRFGLAWPGRDRKEDYDYVAR